MEFLYASGLPEVNNCWELIFGNVLVGRGQAIKYLHFLNEKGLRFKANSRCENLIFVSLCLCCFRVSEVLPLFNFLLILVIIAEVYATA